MENADEHQLPSVEDAESAIDKLPLEILAHVFKLGIHFEKSWEEDEPAVLPWKVSGVCRFWRSVALATPDLWTHVVIESQHLFGSDLDALQLQLERSQQCPLSLRFVGLGIIIPGSYPELALKELKETLRPHLRRARLLKLPAGSWGLILPQVRRSILATSIFPSLREVECTGERFSETDLNSIPFQQLTYISLISMNHTEVLSIIEYSRLTVEVLIIRDASRDIWGHIPTPPPKRDHGIVLPRLKSLTITGDNIFLGETSHSDGDGWIHSAPMLEELTVFGSDDESDLDPIIAFIRRCSSSSDSPPPLTSLMTAYTLPSYDATSLGSFFGAAPTVTSLDMHIWDVDALNLILQLLARTADESASSPVPEFYPSLRSIRLGNDGEDNVFDLKELDLGALVRMVESRRLEKVEIRNGIKLGEEISDEDRDATEMLTERYGFTFV